MSNNFPPKSNTPPKDSSVTEPSSAVPESSAFLAKAVQARLLKDKNEADKLMDLSDGLEWLKDVIDGERERQVTSKLLTFKLLYAGYFGTKGRSTKFARNPCAVREALKFCRENKIAPPDWAMKYVYDLLSGKEQPPSPRDEKRWQNLMKLLDIAHEWEVKAQAGMSEEAIENYFKKKGIGENPLQYVKAFVNPRGKKVVFDFVKNLRNESILEMDAEAEHQAERQLADALTKKNRGQIQKIAG